MARPKRLSEDTVQIRNMRQVLFVLAREHDQHSRLLAASFDRFSAALTTLSATVEALDTRLTHIEDLFEQAVGATERTWLESHGCVVQANEVIRLLRDDVRTLLQLHAAAGQSPAPLALLPREREAAA